MSLIPWPLLGLATTAAACGSSPPAQSPNNDLDAGTDGSTIDGASGDATSGGGGGSADATQGDGDAAQGLHVEGNKLVANGKNVRLLGVNHSGSEYACVGNYGFLEGPTDATLTAAMATWHVNAVRVPLNEDCWLAINGAPAMYSGMAYQKAIADFVALLRGHGMYVIVDLHWNAPGTTISKHQEPMADFDHAPDFWRGVATAFKGDAGVVFDLYNEPFVDTSNAQTQNPWDCWLNGCTITRSPDVTGTWKSAGMQQLVDAVRSTGAKNVIMAGGLAYANDLSGWLAHKPSDPLGQLAASLHLYSFNTCRDAACWTLQVAPVTAAVPLVTGELGEDDCAHGFIDGYMPWADQRGISYLGWTWNVWDCKTGPALITAYDGTPTGFGAGLKAHLLAVSP